MRESSLRGVTSNPAIFEKAILGSTTTTSRSPSWQARAWTRASLPEIAIKDVQLPATCRGPCGTRPAERTARSLEVEPAFAHRTEGTLAQARDF